MPPSRRTCKVCGETKSIKAFTRVTAATSRKHYYTRTCKACKSAAKREAYAALSMEDRRARHARYKYGVTKEELAELWEEQDGRCAICGTWADDEMLKIDHCHDTGKVRGLLCNACNVGIGYFKENVERLARAIAYVEQHQWKVD